MSSEEIARIAKNRQDALMRSNLKVAEKSTWECTVCHQEMTVEEPRTSLLCGHTFHTECVTKFATIKNLPLEQACPMRCHRSSSASLDQGIKTTLAIAVDEAEADAGDLA